MIWQVVLTSLVVLAVGMRWWQKRILKKYKLKEDCDLMRIPIIGHALNGIGNNEVMMEKIMQSSAVLNRQGGTAAIWVGPKLIIGTTDASNVEFILKNHLHRGGLYKILELVLEKGSLVVSDVPVWRPRRKMCAPLFSPKNLSMFVEIFQKQSLTMTKCLENVAGRGPTELWPYLTKYSFDAVCNTTLGVNMYAQESSNNELYSMFMKGMELLAVRLTSPWLHFDTLYKLCSDYRTVKEIWSTWHKFVDEVIRSNAEKRLNSVNEMKYKIQDLTEIFMRTNENGGLSLAEQCKEITTFVMAGMDTSAVSLSFTMHMLALHQDVQEKVYLELMEVFGDKEKEVTCEDLPKLHYLEMVIKETLRLYPSIPLFGRTPKMDVKLPSGETVPKGTFIAINICGIHRNKKYWGDDADQFRPERFLEPFKHPKQFIPFGDGPRNCIGYKYAILSIKTALSNLLRRYRVLPASYSLASRENGNLGSKTNTDEPPFKLKFDLVLKDSKNVLLCLETR